MGFGAINRFTAFLYWTDHFLAFKCFLGLIALRLDTQNAIYECDQGKGEPGDLCKDKLRRSWGRQERVSRLVIIPFALQECKYPVKDSS